MTLIPLQLPTGSRPGRYGHDGNARLINCQVEEAGNAGKIGFPIFAVSGIKQFADATDGPCRGLFPLGSTLYGVLSRQVKPIDVAGSVGTALGGFTGDGAVYMDQNQKTTPQVALVSEGTRKYIESGVLSEISDTDLPPPNSTVTIGGYSIMGIDSGRFHISSINEMTTFAALDFATAEQNPDKLVRAFRRGNELMLMGEKTTEPWTNTGAAAFPFERLSIPPMEFGLLARDSAAIVDEAMVWLAHDGTVRLAEAYNSLRISNHSVERSIAAETDKSTIEGFSYSERGHTYYVLSGTGFTWVFDHTLALTVGMMDAWHERESYTIGRWRARAHAEFEGKNIVGDYSTGKLYEIDPDTYDEAGNHLVMTIQIPVHAYPMKIRLNAIYVDVIPGVGLNSTDAHLSNPQMMCSMSKNGGITFGKERTRSLGGIGERNTRVKFTRFGKTKEDGAIIRISVSAAVIRGISGMAANYDILEA